MAELDHLREELAYLKFWLGILVVIDISIGGWLMSSSDTAPTHAVWLALGGLTVFTAGIVLLHRRIESRIQRIRDS